MEGLMVGIDLCDTYTQVNGTDEEKTWTIPTAVCRNKYDEEWYVGEEAYAHILQGDGIIVDKLITQVMKDGTATLGEVRYEAKELMCHFLELVTGFPMKEYGKQEISQIVIAVRRLDLKLVHILKECMVKLGVPVERVHVISHAEAFVYYTLSQKKEVWSGAVGMFNLSEEGLRYYEMKIQRGLKRMTVTADYEELDEGFNLDILKTSSGTKLADKILCSCAERVMQKKLYASMLLSGSGFDDRSWAEGFMKSLSGSRRLFLEEAVFAKGAAYQAVDFSHEKTSYPFVCICEGRLRTTISMNVVHKGQETSVTVAAAGDCWYERRAVIDVIPDHQNTVEFVVTPPDVRQKKLVSIPLEGFPDRLDRTMRVRILVTFLDGHTMDVRLKDQGFGELFPSSGVQIRQEVML